MAYLRVYRLVEKKFAILKICRVLLIEKEHNATVQAVERTPDRNHAPLYILLHRIGIVKTPAEESFGSYEFCTNVFNSI